MTKNTNSKQRYVIEFTNFPVFRSAKTVTYF